MLEQTLLFLQSPETKQMLLDSFEMFVQLFIELSGLFLLISFAVSLINEKLPAEKIQIVLGGRGGSGYLSAAALGALTPFCSCSTIPMLVGLLKARAGFGPTMTFLFTSPLLNPIILALFIPTLGLNATLWYAGLALSISILAGIILNILGFERFINPALLEEKPKSCCATSCTNQAPTIPPTIWQKSWQSTWDLFKQMFPYMVIAMLIGALVHGFVPADFFTQVAGPANPVAVPTAAVVGIPLYIRVTTLLPLVGSFMAKGVSLGAIIALVVGSGGASLPEVILLKKLFYWPLLLAFLLVIFSMAVIGGFTFNYLLL